MANNTIDRLLEAFLEASGGKAVGSEKVTGEGIADGSDVYSSSANPVGSNVYGSPSGPSQSSGGSTAGSVATTFLESGLGVASLVEGLVGLFSGGSSAAAPLEKYEMPSAIDFESAETAWGLSGVDYGQSGNARPIGQENGSSGSSSQAAAGSGQQITVNVQTMDAQSFMDNSNAIAQAVRGAMLNSSSINDVVNEL